MSNYGSPFRNTDSGIKIRDSENEKRVRLAFENFWKSKEDDKEFQKKLQTSISKSTATNSRIIAPIVGLLVGKSFNDLFCNPKHSYFRAYILFLTTMAGYYVGSDAQNRYEYSLYTRNFHLFPEELQQALVNGDARYCTQWWQK